ncbi:hypothetical protein FE257_009863 [Aspergillus nanangensis]|uniref:Alpha methylacyl-CoA racemase n=1 Tax=Aspergillus nanangensis TaxID=2582783 RepID=A0AAD4GYF2_ASPNN|nr:hypothetical protein FE257_009863 [Aspergillus nanangensis]
MGSSNYSVPREAEALFQQGILHNPDEAGILPAELLQLAQKVHFEGNDTPSIPINWRLAESISALKALEATMVNLLLVRKYGVEPVEVTINTDHASLFFMSPLITQILDENGHSQPFTPMTPKIHEMFPNQDKHRTMGFQYRSLATNIYATQDGRYYHTHGSMNPDPTLTALGLPLDDEDSSSSSYDSIISRIQTQVQQHTANHLDTLLNDQYRQAGTIAHSVDEYLASEHGRANRHAGLYEITPLENQEQDQDHPPSWWPNNPSLPSSPQRPLAGLKVVDLTRVIAGPTISRSLAELGASVMRVVSPHVTDLSALHQDLNWGKWNAYLHLKEEGDREKLRELIREADVVVDGYRPGVMERLGFGREKVLELVRGRERGIVHVRENCYGWHGPWRGRSGWQQISDACCGVSMGYGQAMGVDEPVTPVFPNSDYCTGVIGCAGILDALLQRAEKGGSYGVDTSLNYYSQWLVRTCGTYNAGVWNDLWRRHSSPVFRHYHAMQHLIPSMLKLLHTHDKEVLFNPRFFEPRVSPAVGATFIQVKPVAQFKDNAVELKYNVGTRGNGVDEAVWPRDLTVEIVVS